MAWLSLILFVACIAPLSQKTPVAGITGSVLMGTAFLFSLVIVLKSEPCAIRVYADRFEVCYFFRRGVYYYSDINDVSMDVVVMRKSDDLKTVRVDFKSGRPFQLASLGHRHRLYEDLHSSWRAAA